jgi:hypothetical protein
VHCVLDGEQCLAQVICAEVAAVVGGDLEDAPASSGTPGNEVEGRVLARDSVWMYRGVEVVATAENADPFAHPCDGGGLPAVAADSASQALLRVHELRVRRGRGDVCALRDIQS